MNSAATTALSLPNNRRSVAWLNSIVFRTAISITCNQAQSRALILLKIHTDMNISRIPMVLVAAPE